MIPAMIVPPHRPPLCPPPSPILPGRPNFRAVAATVVGLLVLLFAAPSNILAQGATGDAAIRPFHFTASDDVLSDLRIRIAATRWPEKETVADDSQGVRLATMQALARYWGTDYDWRACETKLNALPNFVTEIDGLDIHFIHVRSQHDDALPLIVTHG